MLTRIPSSSSSERWNSLTQMSTLRGMSDEVRYSVRSSLTTRLRTARPESCRNKRDQHAPISKKENKITNVDPLADPRVVVLDELRLLDHILAEQIDRSVSHRWRAVVQPVLDRPSDVCLQAKRG